MKKSRKILWSVLIVLLVLNVYLLATGKMYYYKALVYNYVNIDDLDLFPYNTVKKGNAEPWPIANDYNQQPLTAELSETLDRYQSVAFLVIKNDSIRLEHYWDGYSDTSHSNSFSMAKSIISILIGIAEHEGKIRSLDDAVCDYLPWFCDNGKEKISIRQMLMMSSGLNWDEGYASLTSPVTRMYYGKHLDEQMMTIAPVVAPGVEYNYMSCNTQILGLILQKVTGKSISDYASEKLWSKIGAESDAFWSLDQEGGVEKAYCCFYSNARDFARLGKLYLQHGKWGNEQVVPEDYVAASVTPAPLDNNGKPNTIYGYQWWLTSYEDEKIFYARGILGQYIFVIPDQKIIFVRLGHKRGEKDADGELLDTPVYIREVMKMYGNTMQDSLAVQQ